VFEMKKEILDSHEAILTLEIDDKTERRAIQKAARRISREVDIPGFRKGKAPPNVIMRMFGKDVLLQEAAEELLEDLYPKALDRAEITPYGPGQIEDLNLSPMRIKVRVPLMPVVTLGDYENLRMEFESAEIAEEELADVLENVREEHAILEPVDRAAADGDVLSLDLIEAEVDGEDIVHEHDIEVVLDPEQEFIVPGVIEELIGLSEGEEKTFVLSLPEDLEEDLAGKEATFTVEVDQVYDRMLPELDDALASTVGNYETLEELKEDLRQEMQEYKNREEKKEYRDALIDALIADAELHYPPLMVEEELDDILDSIENNVKQRQNLDWEEFLERAGATEEELREQMRSQAVKNVERSLVLAEFADVTDVQVSDEEVEAEMRQTLLQMGIEEPSLLEAFQVDSRAGQDTRSRLMGRKTIERLERLAQGLPLEEPEPEPEEVSEVEEQEEAPVEMEPVTEDESEVAVTDASESDADEGEVDTETA
jgi:trigger factor